MHPWGRRRARERSLSWGRQRARERSLSVVPCVMSRVLSPRRGESPPFYRPRRGQFTGIPHYLATCGGMTYSAAELTVVLANLAPVMASWRALCLNRGGFEG
jgi:hypothetical protein